MAELRPSPNLKKYADAMNATLRDMQALLGKLSKEQQALFNAVHGAVGPKKLPKAGIKAGLDGIQKPLKDLDGKLKEYAALATKFAQEGSSDADKLHQKKPAVAPK